MSLNLNGLVQRVREEGGDVRVREIRRWGKQWAKSEVVEKALGMLMNAGYGETYVELPGAAGGRPSVRFRLFKRQAMPRAGYFP